jgi:hypothetical protein
MESRNTAGTASRHAILKNPRPAIEPLEPRRVLTASALSAPPDQSADAQDVMASFEEFLSDRAAQQYAARRNNAPFPAAPAVGTPGARAVQPMGASPTATIPAATTAPTPATTTTSAMAPGPASAYSATISGDVNGDGQVNADDLVVYEAGFAKYDAGVIPPGTATRADGDATGDGMVNYRDYLIIYNAMTAVVPTPPSPVNTNPVLFPGSGFAGPTAQPPARGTPGQQGYDEKAIARWDVVPYQTFDTTMNVGVVAFHFNGIDRVEFSVNGGRPAAVTSMTRNPQTGVVEYWATLDVDKFATDGPVEVRAVAYPKVGVPRVLKPLPLNVNGQHTIPTLVRYVSPAGSNTTGDGSPGNPFQTIKQAAMSIQQQTPEQNVDDGTIYLLPGDYAFSGGWNGPSFVLPLTEYAWLTVAAAPGVPADQVRITVGGSAERLNASLIHLENLTLYDTSLVSSTNLNRPAAIWFDNCVLASTGPADNEPFAVATAWTGGIYATDTLIHDAANGLAAATLERNVSVRNIQSDAFQNAETIINCSVEDIDSNASDAHPDVLQYFAPAGTIENRIIYGLTATNGIGAQGVFAGSGFALKDIAIVDCRIDTSLSAFYAFQFCGPTRHMYVAGSSFAGALGGAWRVDAGFTAKDVLVKGTSFSNNLSAVAGVTYR